MTIEELLNHFYSDLILVKRDSEQTALTYKISCGEFLNWLVEQRIKLRDVTVQNLMYFLVKRKTDGASELTISKDISALRSFGDYLVRKSYWTENLALLLDRPKVSRNLPKVLSLEEVEALLGSIDTSTDLGKRDDAIYELIYSCGLRISEACSLLIANVHMEEGLILVRGKGNKERLIPFGGVARKKLELYLHEVRPKLVKERNVAEVFVNYK